MPRYTYELPPHRVTTKRLALNELNVDPHAQRAIRTDRVRLLTDTWSAEAAGTIVVSQRRNDTYWVVDGQTRAEAARRVGQTQITAEVHHGLDQAAEATLFLMKNRESTRPTPIDEYNIGLTAGLPEFTETRATLDAHKLDMGNSGTNSVGAVQGVLAIVRRDGPEGLDRTLTIAEAAWGRTSATWDGMLLSGVGLFLNRWGDTLARDDTETARKIAARGDSGLWRSQVISQASGNGTRNSGTTGRTAACYGLVVQAWNVGRRTPNRIPLVIS